MTEECLRLNQACNDPEGTANALRNLATTINAQGDPLRAHQLCQQALALHRSLNHQLGMGLDHVLLGDISYAQGDDEAALAHYHQCLNLWRERENSVNSTRVFESIARILSHRGDAERAAMLMATAAAVREQAGAKLTNHEQACCDETVYACRTRLTEGAFTAAWTMGRILTTRQAIDLALKPLNTSKLSLPLAYGQRGAGQARLWQGMLFVHDSQPAKVAILQ
jgi:tetratricopeptide (TPR) repeat protein